MRRSHRLVLPALLAALCASSLAHADFPRFPPAKGGGISTVSTSAPVSGNGSSGSPVTISAPGSTLLGNSTGSTAAPTPISLGANLSFSGSSIVAASQFGSDTTLQLPDATSVLVNSLELINTLTSTTHGATTSQWQLKLGNAGAFSPFLTLSPSALDVSPTSQIIAPIGTAAAPGVQLNDNQKMGMYWAGSGNLGFAINGTPGFQLQTGSATLRRGSSTTAVMNFEVSGANITYNATNGNMTLTGAAGGYFGMSATRFEQATGANIASANTLTLGTDGNVFNITGTTTINGIVTTNWVAGSRVTLQLASGITVTNNSGTPGAGAVAIQLRAGANLTTSAIYFLDLIYNGTFWYQPN